MTKNIVKYLANYAEPEIAALEQHFPKQCFAYAVVVPAYKETSDFISHVKNSALSTENALFIFVINQPDTDINSQPQQLLMQAIESMGKVIWQVNNLTLVAIESLHLLVVDRFTTPIPVKQGVGSARKIGADIALALMQKGAVSSRLIHSTDADVKLPNNYFSALNNLPARISGACYNFSHSSTDKLVHDANQQYEQALRYYVSGLRYARSHYAYFTIGSTLVFDAESYASVRGFPKRSAGEDFYLLNKLAKLGSIEFIENSTLAINARLSDRVPFGTGPAVGQIIALEQAGECYHYYHPEVFNELKQVLCHSAQLWIYREDLPHWLNDLSNESAKALSLIGFEGFVAKHIKHNQTQFNKQWLVWFDALKTLKFIHALRDIAFPNMPLSSALSLAPFTTR